MLEDNVFDYVFFKEVSFFDTFPFIEIAGPVKPELEGVPGLLRDEPADDAQDGRDGEYGYEIRGRHVHSPRPSFNSLSV